MREKQKAFTLLEMMVATTIFVLLALLMSQIIGPAIEVVSKGRRVSDLQSRARAALDVIARDVGNGIYRADLTTFSDGTGDPALAFFTRRPGLAAPTADPSDSRQLSFVVYEVLSERSGQPDFSLWRGSINVEWDDNQTYPPMTLSGPLPFITGGVATAFQQSSQAPTLEPVLEGVLRLELRFLGTDGLYRNTYNSDPTAVDPVSKAVSITLLVTDEKTHGQIVADPTLVTALTTNFLGSSGKLLSPNETDVSLGTLWNQALADSTTWSGLPPRLRNIYAFERIIPLR